MSDQEIVRTDSTVVYTNRWMTVREDTIRRRDGVDGIYGIYGIVEKVDYSLIIPFDGACVHLVEQFRYPVGARYWELPQGSWEGDRAADPLTVAIGELAEETGLHAGTMTPLGTLFQAYGYSTQSVHVFLATDLVAGEQSLDPEEIGLESASFPLDTFRSMTLDGTIRDASTVAAAHLFFNHPLAAPTM